MRLKHRRIHKGLRAAAAGALLALSGSAAHAVSGGIAGYSGKGGTTCATSGCHGANDATVSIADPIDLGNPTLMYPGEARTFAISAARALNSGAQGAGIDIATSDGALSVAGSDSTTTKLSGTEIVHSGAPKKSVTGNATVSYNFVYTMPANALPADAARTIYGAAQIDKPGGGGNTTRAVGVKLPAQPGALGLTPSSTSIAVTWTGTTPNFKVLYKTGSYPSSVTDATATVLYEGANTSASATNLNPSTQYFFSVFGKGGVAYSTLARQAETTTNAVVAQTYYVNGASGNNANAGSQAAPFRTITKATTVSAIGDVINVLPGTYNSALGETFPIIVKSGVVLQSTGNALNTIIDATNSNNRVMFGEDHNANTLIAGFTIKGGMLTDQPGFQTRGGGIFLEGTCNTTIRNNLILGNTAKGYDGFSTSFPSGGGAFGGGIYVSSGNPKIFNNIFRNNSAQGGNGFNSPSGGSAGDGTYAAGGGIYVSGGSGLVVNNTFYGNAALGGNGGTTSAATGGNGGESQGGGAYLGAATARNNIFSHNGSIGGSGGAGSSSHGINGEGGEGGATAFVTETNNLFFQNTADDGDTGEDAITGQDPLFVNGANGDFHLQALSPAKGAGISTNAPAVDFDGITRGNPPSIGAFEGGVAVDTTPPAIAISLPANSVAIKVLPAITAIATDDGGSGIAQVLFYLRRRKADNSFEYWDQRSGVWGWGAIGPFPAAVNGSVPGGYVTNNSKPVGMQMPAGANLGDGLYSVYALALDVAGNGKTSATNTFYVDNGLPTAVTITTPVDKTIVKGLTLVKGTATDNVGGSGIHHVDLTLRRLSDGKYWGGSTWGAALVTLPTTVVGTDWTKNSGFPAPGPNVDTQLQEGKFTIRAAAYDKAQNHTVTSAQSDITIDSTVPATITMATPANATIVKQLTPIAGTAGDNAGGTGIAKVDFTLRRSSDQKYWNGETWAVAPTTLPTVLSGANWTKNTGLPALGDNVDTQLQDGKYFLSAAAVDKAGNKSVAATNQVTLDRTLPLVVTIAVPANLSNVKAFTAANGNAADNAGGSGILKVEVTLRRSSDLKYWNGTMWAAAITQLPANAVSGTWNKNSGFPAAGSNVDTQLTEGKYILSVSSTDKAGNKSASTISSFTVDRTLPTVAILAPANDDVVTALTALSGTAFDGQTGAASINLVLKRASDGWFWNGTAWVSTTFTLTTVAKPTTGGNATWTYGGQGQLLPSGANLVNGSYSLTARSVDKAGNLSAAAVSNFILALSGGLNAPAVATSPVQLSAIAATADGRVQLTFTGALKASAAVDVSRYSAGTVAVESAGTAGASVVILGLDAVKAGDRLTVGYDLLDANGLSVKGQASAVVR